MTLNKTEIPDAVTSREPVTAAREPVVLIVEQDPSILRFLSTAVRLMKGGAVIETPDPASALALAWASGRPVEFLITETEFVGGKTGLGLARRIAAVFPAAKIILLAPCQLPPDSVPAHWKVLEKPFPLADLLGCIRELYRPATRAMLAGKNPSAA